MSDAVQRIVEARVEPYALAFARPWRSRHGLVRERAGWLVHLVDTAGHRATGECAPWPDAGTETHSMAESALRTRIGQLDGLSVAEALSRVDEMTATPAARCGLEGALLDLDSRASGIPLRHLLSGAAADVVAVNAACGAAGQDLAGLVADACAAGFRVLKVKVGVAPWAQELAAIRALRLPIGVSLRLDANGAWDETTAAACLGDLHGLPVDAVEEPLAGFQPAALRRLQRLSPASLALDEALGSCAEAAIGDDCPVRRVVLKPMVLGGARRTMVLAQRARLARLETVVTTTLEAAPGRWLVAAVASATGSPLAHGLDTGSWLAEDLGEGPRITDGSLRFHDRE